MTRSRRRAGRGARTARRTLKEKGLTAMALGVGLLVMAFVLNKPGPMAAVAKGLATPAWVVLGIGIVLVVLDALLQRSGGGGSEQPVAKVDPTLATNSRLSRTISVDPPAHAPTHWNAAVFAAIEWRRFEAVVETLFAQAGFETRSQSHGADGGVDIWLRSKNADGPVSVVQCKHWQGKPVTVKELREFLGVMASHGLKRGTYATTSRYTADALEFAKANGINAQDGNDLLRLIAQRSPEQQARLLEVAYEGEYWKPTCANCGVKMVQREAKRDGSRFWGCMNYPRCKCTLPMKAAD